MANETDQYTMLLGKLIAHITTPGLTNSREWAHTTLDQIMDLRTKIDKQHRELMEGFRAKLRAAGLSS